MRGCLREGLREGLCVERLSEGGAPLAAKVASVMACLQALVLKPFSFSHL